ncbi:hypothetical protein Aeqsu_2707 [Aequorivita sublithincola DSM 14238]|uniref:Outer membrane protein n=1 Tax=Aequorivita sublithincola (strain DSM 14238 / LMG 21431 / ACAM 643 / 9-3) TaxID=746697 RepID=I3YYU0_AEQSU|nr:hypothetical protein [Aequorivita sublithincola]AFL82158.1 hypothetical protein Aeqsu_2707 [Aequorivita sublithincola DSM 14238]
MKKLFTILTLFISITAFSQDPFLQKSNLEAKKEAIKLTDRYNRELALSGDQILLFQQKVEEFLIRRQEIEAAGFTGKLKLDQLYKNQQEETADMQDILTHQQLQVYKQVKPEIQPLEIVKEKAKKDD